LDIANITNEKQKSLFEHLSIMHILCVVITMLGTVLYNKSLNSYMTGDICLYFLLNLICFEIIMLYSMKKQLLQNDLKVLSVYNVIYVSFPLFIAVLNLFLARDNIFYLKTILILPVLFAASVMGKAAGMVMATACSFFLVVFELSFEDMIFWQALESNLIIISMMYIIGWFIGVLIDNNRQYQEQLKENILSLNREINFRKQMELQSQKLSRVVEQCASIIMISDVNGNIEYVNPKFVEVTGYQYEKVIGKKVRKPVGLSQEEYDELWKVISSGGEWQGEFSSRKRNGEIYWEFATVSPFRNNDGIITHYIKVAEDVTERKRVANEMARLDRLHMVGEMAASIGHEIRNPMTTVRGFLQLLEKKEDCARYSGYFTLMIDELDRANSIINEYLSLAKNKAVDLKVQNIKQIVETIAPLIAVNAMNSDKHIKLELEDIPDILLNEKEIRQLILNLVNNGLEAMSPGGTVVIRTFLDGRDVVLAVQDQGKGIEPELLEKLGTPFFTTKEKGTGLGLAVCYSIAARHGAEIKIETGPTGSTFSVIFRSATSKA